VRVYAEQDVEERLEDHAALPVHPTVTLSRSLSLYSQSLPVEL
jgi:hypothetical protein